MPMQVFHCGDNVPSMQPVAPPSIKSAASLSLYLFFFTLSGTLAAFCHFSEAAIRLSVTSSHICSADQHLGLG